MHTGGMSGGPRHRGDQLKEPTAAQVQQLLNRMLLDEATVEMLQTAVVQQKPCGLPYLITQLAAKSIDRAATCLANLFQIHSAESEGVSYNAVELFNTVDCFTCHLPAVFHW